MTRMRAALAETNILRVHPRNAERRRYRRRGHLGQKWLNPRCIGLLIEPFRLARWFPTPSRGGIAALCVCTACLSLALERLCARTVPFSGLDCGGGRVWRRRARHRI